ncbi:hypothetical protein LQH79_005108 [Salmonella enterica]|uniref:GDCCVxC domain-containing (seleno)protein n=2 Tax=Gammaproteobacteria TaxID=1236 RepID=UPI001273E1FC|nr:GDCCVxC domain-containing (seleno)protein [Proteus penneri]ECG9085082.1 hypothetical protein [Salmonella enterica]EHP8144089.1 hypothetical protein [Salmonella enterica subsp. enterica serovar London]WEP15039.1 GDCCVxC domain-containing (seleno)protein [Salmonella enterica subsp. enterica serovar 4,[5],12:i:-]HCP2072343.1 hypothetical protein [Escherichia coli]ECG9086315.1 hypothetical protein [Salmonella enterica]
MSAIVLESVLTCPRCGFAKPETMPTDACQFYYECSNCKALLRPNPGDCCVFCCGRKIKCHPNYRTLQRSNSCKNPFKTMTYFNSAICKRFVGMEAGIIKVSS